ncbi:hypothetical protein GEMRC1_004305 [Eukaryota sp. GEM-RC1]
MFNLSLHGRSLQHRSSLNNPSLRSGSSFSLPAARNSSRPLSAVDLSKSSRRKQVRPHSSNPRLESTPSQSTRPDLMLIGKNNQRPSLSPTEQVLFETVRSRVHSVSPSPPSPMPSPDVSREEARSPTLEDHVLFTPKNSCISSNNTFVSRPSKYAFSTPLHVDFSPPSPEHHEPPSPLPSTTFTTTTDLMILDTISQGLFGATESIMVDLIGKPDEGDSDVVESVMKKTRKCLSFRMNQEFTD